MKQTFTSKRFFGTLILALLLGIACPNHSAAQNFPTNRGSLVLIPSEKNKVFPVTPSQNGTMQIITKSETFFADFLFTDEECTEVFRPKAVYHTDMGFIYNYMVEKGSSYFFTMKNNDYPYETSIDVLYQNSGAAPYPTLVFPERKGEGVPLYHLSNAPELQLIFNNKAITFDNALLEFVTNGGEERTVELDIMYITYDQSWRIFVKNMVDQLKNEIKNQSEMRIVLTNAQANGQKPSGEYADGDNFVFPYLYVSQTAAISAVWPDPFLTYWPKGDPKGIAVITFDGELKPLEQQENIEYGLYAGDDFESEDGMIQMPTPELQINGNKITIDFTGVVYEHLKDVATMMISGIEDIYDMPFVYGGTNGIFQVMPFEVLEPLALAYEFTPDDGKSLKNVDEIELWFDNEMWKHIDIEGFTFENGEESETVGINDCRQEPDPLDPDNYSLIYIPVPEMAKEGGAVSLRAEIVSLDGHDYEIRANYLNDEETDTTGVCPLKIAEDRKGIIYNLTGVKVGEASARPALPAGVYILDGKKILIK